MKTHYKLFALPSCATAAGIVLTLIAMATTVSLASTPNFVVLDDTALRIRFDDTLTSIDSNVGDPFSATVVDQGNYQNARVYGHIELAWHIRDGLLGIVGEMRPQGTNLIIEDVCFPPAQLANATRDLLALLAKHGYEPSAAGHAAYGNLHFVMIARLSEDASRQQYDAFMRDLVELVVGKYDGSLKIGKSEFLLAG